MTIYVSLPQVPLTLKFEEPLDEVVEHIRGLVGEATVHAYQTGDGQTVLVNYAVIACVAFQQGVRALEVSELNRGIPATIS